MVDKLEKNRYTNTEIDIIEWINKWADEINW